MQVILLEKIHKLGGFGEVVNVKDGYGRNFLLPRKKAIRATKPNIEYFEQKKALLAKEHEEKRAAAELLLKDLEGLEISLIRQAGEDGRLYGSVSAKDIITAIFEKGKKQLEPDMVELHHKFKSIGIHEVTLKLHPDVTTVITLNIVRNAEEVKEIVKKGKA